MDHRLLPEPQDHRAVLLPSGRIAVRCWPLSSQPWMTTDPSTDPMGTKSPTVGVRWLRDSEIPAEAVPLVPDRGATSP